MTYVLSLDKLPYLSFLGLYGKYAPAIFFINGTIRQIQCSEEKKRTAFSSSLIEYLSDGSFLRTVFLDEDFSGFGALGRTDHTLLFQQIDHSCGAVIADAESSLQE